MNFPMIRVADGALLHSSKGLVGLAVAGDQDWAECLEMARRNISNGGAQVGSGETWEQALANNAARLLHTGIAGTGFPAMGRTPDQAAWAPQEARWLDLVFEVAERGSSHVAWDRVSNPPVFEPTGTVHTIAGRVPLESIPREPR